MADLNVSCCLMGKGTPGQICKAEPPEITLPGLSHQTRVDRPEEWAVALVSAAAALCADILACLLSEEEQTCLSFHVGLVSLQFLPEDQFLYLYLVAPVGTWRYKSEQN